jgi:hypothetical protein
VVKLGAPRAGDSGKGFAVVEQTNAAIEQTETPVSELGRIVDIFRLDDRRVAVVVSHRIQPPPIRRELRAGSA